LLGGYVFASVHLLVTLSVRVITQEVVDEFSVEILGRGCTWHEPVGVILGVSLDLYPEIFHSV